MEILDLMKKRHSVRSYLDKSLDDKLKSAIKEYIDNINNKYSTHHQIFFDDPEGFKNSKASYGLFKGCNNYIVLVCDNPFDAGYSGELIVLKLQALGLNSCFVGLTYKRNVVKNKIKLANNDKIQCVIAFGYGDGTGRPHKNRNNLLILKGNPHPKLDKVVEACMLAPTAINQQKFRIVCENSEISIIKKGIGPYIDMDLGIVTCHKDLILESIFLD